MKKQSNGMNKRQIRRKLGLKLNEKEMENMFQDIQTLINKDVFSSVHTNEQFVTIDKKKLVHTLKGKMKELEHELKQLTGDSIGTSLPIENCVSKQNQIKINIS